MVGGRCPPVRAFSSLCVALGPRVLWDKRVVWVSVEGVLGFGRGTVPGAVSGLCSVFRLGTYGRVTTPLECLTLPRWMAHAARRTRTPGGANRAS